MKCYNSKLDSVQEIDVFFDMRERMYQIAKSVVKNLGLWYEDLTTVVDTYVSSWLQLGFDEDALLKLSNYAFKTSIRTLEGFNNQVNNMFKVGVLSSESLDKYLEEIVKNDEVIANILNKLDIARTVNSTDRTFYKTWLFDWKLNEEIIEYAVEQSKGKYMPMQYLNKILSEYHMAGINSVEDAKNYSIKQTSVAKSGTTKTSSKDAEKRQYSKKELDSLFDNIYEVEI